MNYSDFHIFTQNSQKTSPTVFLSAELISTINDFNNNNDIHGIVLQLPLPPHLSLNFNQFLNKIDPAKDVDCLHENNYNKTTPFSPNKHSSLPCVVMAIDLLLQKYQIECKNKSVVILGKSFLVGLPVQTLFQNKGSFVELCDQFTLDIISLIEKADILVFATGKEIKLSKDNLKNGCVIFDIGIRMKNENGEMKVTGDVDVFLKD